MTRHRRNSLRLRGYDYASTGAYFVTICTANRAPLFGTIEGDRLTLNGFGDIVSDAWQQLIIRTPDAGLDEFIVMPDHFHAIVWLNPAITADGRDTVGANDYPPHANNPTHLRFLVRTFKGSATTAINTARNTPGRPVWQRNYYDRVVRDDRELNAAREYVRYNVEKCLMMRESSNRHQDRLDGLSVLNPGRIVIRPYGVRE